MNDVVLRLPSPAEMPRALHLFGASALPQRAGLMVAAKSRPLERFVAAMASWTEGEFLRFALAFQPGVSQSELAGLLIDGAAAAARAIGFSKLLYGELLNDDDPRASLLRAHGFEVLRSERFFRIASTPAAERVVRMITKYAGDIPRDWRTDSIRNHGPEVVFDLIGTHRLMTRDEIIRYWRPNAMICFEPDMSNIIFEGDRAFGTLLSRRMGDVLLYDIRVVNHPNRRLRGLANLCLLHHNLRTYDPSQVVHWLQFRGGETEHRETANLALRMGGTELPRKHAFYRLA